MGPGADASGEAGRAADAAAPRTEHLHSVRQAPRLFEKDGRGVFIPYEKFQELLKAAQNAGAKLPEIKPPVGGLITAIESEATIGRDVVLVKAKLSIEMLQEGWVRVPLRLADSAIRPATIGKEPARLIGSEQGYELLYEKKGEKPETIELALEYSKAFTKVPRQQSRFVSGAAGGGESLDHPHRRAGREGERASASRHQRHAAEARRRQKAGR